MVVGIVVFLIITIVQFVVITKGSERVAEVSARFSLDALPGRQMSIDSDMRAGEIDMSEAKRRRQALQLESEFYGSMDGAMKFVKGDAIAGIIIIFVNILGGIAVGVMQMEMSFGEAADIYTVLTVGDGLVSQIPALFMAISSGVVITRITHDKSVDLGSDIAEQVSGNPRALQIAALILFVMAFVPGFPMFVFLLLAAFLGGLGFWTEVQAKQAASTIEGEDYVAAERKQDIAMTPMAAVHMIVDRDLYRVIDPTLFASEATVERTRLFNQLGVPFPPLILNRGTNEGFGWQLVVEGVPIAEGDIPAGKLRITDDPVNAKILDIPLEEAQLKPTPLTGMWADRSHAEALSKNGIAYQTPEGVLVTLAGEVLPSHAQDFLGVHETS